MGKRLILEQGAGGTPRGLKALSISSANAALKRRSFTKQLILKTKAADEASAAP
jgi:hypothetical protein